MWFEKLTYQFEGASTSSGNRRHQKLEACTAQDCGVMEAARIPVGGRSYGLPVLHSCSQAHALANSKGWVSLPQVETGRRNCGKWLWRTNAVGVRACAESSAGGTVDKKKLPDKKKALYSHSLPSIEQWLTSLGFHQSKVDRAVWLAERPDWHAQLSLDLTELHIKYLKSGPGNLEKDVERKFSYALSREDLDNAILGGP